MRTEHEARELILRGIHRSSPESGRVEVIFTDNSSTMISRSDRNGAPVLRIHRIFSKAPESLLAEIGRSFFSHLRRSESRAVRARLKDFIDAHRIEINLRPLTAGRAYSPKGRCFDLQRILDRVKRRCFPEVGPVDVAWSQRVLKRLMGKWIENPPPLPNMVLINRLLDTPEVPEYYLEFLIFHELLHEAFPIRRSSGRWIHHSAEFRAREKEHPEFQRARRWEARNVARLYRRFQRGQSRSRKS